MVVHNHPSGELEPTDHDLALTRRIDQGAQLLDLMFEVHVIVTPRADWFRFRSSRLLKQSRRQPEIPSEEGACSVAKAHVIAGTAVGCRQQEGGAMSSSGQLSVGEQVQVTPAREGLLPASGFVTATTSDGFTLYLDSVDTGGGQLAYPAREVKVLWADVGTISQGPAPLTLVRRYHGSQRSATQAFELDSQTLGRFGYMPINQEYVPGTWGPGAWILAFLALILLIGIIVLAYMVVVRPDGELMVTYRLQGATGDPAPGDLQATVSQTTATGASANPDTGSYACPRCAETIKRAAKMCRFCQLDLTATT